MKLAQLILEGITYSNPNFSVEWEEAIRYPEFEEMGKEGWIDIAKKGYTTSFSKIKNALGNVDLDFDGLEEPKKQRFQDAFKRGTIEMSIAVKFSDKDYDLIAGNTRLSGLVKNGIDPKIWIVDLSNLSENYAAGKVEGKSTPQTKGYTLKTGEVITLEVDPSRLTYGSLNITAYDKDNNKIGAAYFNSDETNDPKILSSTDTSVKPDWRRKGVATAIYNFAKTFGYKIVKSTNQTPQGNKFTDSFQENYADGKVKGKSRPGRVKKSGASCKGSVTDLRAKAKKYGGEKGKMYHWCANMKAGKK